MPSQELVTVIISSYNHAPYIEESILSVVEQTYPHIELLVVDDGSTDDSVSKIEALQRIRGFDFRVQKNQGLTRTLNETITRAKGNWVAPFGSDDIMLSDRLSLQMAYIADKPEVGICAGNMELMDSDGTPYPNQNPQNDPPFRRLDFEDVFLQRKPFAPAPTLLIRKEAFEKAGGFNPDIRLEDLYIQLKITHAGYFIDALGTRMARYRKHPTNTYKNIRFMTESVLRIYQDYADHPDYEQVRFRFLNSMLAKSSRRDKKLAGEILAQLPLRAWNRRTLASLLRYPFAPIVS
ncbi:glycosyltransferase [Azonexus sp.]|jgi:alpha-1,3-rhamnosyltransferase|uniref:glycosyltransferase n=1 Tax=Azonexus sp. TaxID=1872668 RepID=UPI00282C6218|nr:glycosyltransferase [Azonexus sp.]MDR1996645.1 glycosyltransferase [Azonexus sp.]